MKKSKTRINNQISAPEVRVLDTDGKQIGVLPTSEALSLAKEQGKDLIEIAAAAVPPVVKIMELGKFLYIEEKREREQKKKSKAAEVKEIRLSPFIAEGDYQTRIRRIDYFLKHGHKVRLVVVFKGRHLNSKKFGYELIGKVLQDIEHNINIDMEPKFLGRHLQSVISPLKKKKKETNENAEN